MLLTPFIFFSSVLVITLVLIIFDYLRPNSPLRKREYIDALERKLAGSDYPLKILRNDLAFHQRKEVYYKTRKGTRHLLSAKQSRQ